MRGRGSVYFLYSTGSFTFAWAIQYAGIGADYTEIACTRFPQLHNRLFPTAAASGYNPLTHDNQTYGTDGARRHSRDSFGRAGRTAAHGRAGRTRAPRRS